MNSKNKSIALVSIISSIILMFSYFPLCAVTSNTLSSPSPISPSPISPSIAEHKQTTSQYIDQLKTIQNRTFQLLQLTLDNPIKDPSNFKKNINLVNNDIVNLLQKILEYQKNIPSSSIQFRDILLILSAINYSKNALFNLEALSQTTANVEKALLLENFFKYRLEGIDALNIVQTLISQY